MPKQRATPLPYGRHDIDSADLESVSEALQSEWLTTGPRVQGFESAFAAAVGARHAVAVNSGTAALHASMSVLNIGPGDEVLVPAITFAASANCVVYQGGMPVFVDVEESTLCIDSADAARKISPRTKAIVAVDYAGQPCDYEALNALAARFNLPIVSDACHALGARWGDRSVGTVGTLNTFSFHPVKHITTGEGGMVTTESDELAQRLRIFRNHGIATDLAMRERANTHSYDMVSLGFNYRMPDILCALGASQLRRLPHFLERRRQLAARYDQLLSAKTGIVPLSSRPGIEHAYHLYVVRLVGASEEQRDRVYRGLREARYGVNVHYKPVYQHSFYRQRIPDAACPVAERVYPELLTLPLYPAMDETDVDEVVAALTELI